MSFGLTFDKVIIIAVIAVFLVGPERLPGYAAQLARLVRAVRTMADGAKVRLRDEMGSDFDEVDWKKLDPRQYDPRRIIRDALLDNPAGPPVETITNHDRVRDDTVAADAASPERTTNEKEVPPHAR